MSMKWYLNAISAIEQFCMSLLAIWTSSFMNGLFVSVLLLTPCAPSSTPVFPLLSSIWGQEGRERGTLPVSAASRKQKIGKTSSFCYIYAPRMPIVFQLYSWHLLQYKNIWLLCNKLSVCFGILFAKSLMTLRSKEYFSAFSSIRICLWVWHEAGIQCLHKGQLFQHFWLNDPTFPLQF